MEDKGGETGTAEVVDGWKRCCINSGLLSGAVHDYHYTEGKILYSPHPYHFSPFFFFSISFVVTHDFVFNTCLKERWVVFTPSSLVLNTSAVHFLIFPLFYSSSLSLPLLRFLISVSIFSALFPIRVCPFN